MITEYTRVCERKACIICKQQGFFVKSFDKPSGKGAFGMRHSFLYLFPLVRISKALYTNSRPLVYVEGISPKTSATAACIQKNPQIWSQNITHIHTFTVFSALLTTDHDIQFYHPLSFRKLTVFDDWSSICVHVAMDNTVIVEDISEYWASTPTDCEQIHSTHSSTTPL